MRAEKPQRRAATAAATETRLGLYGEVLAAPDPFAWVADLARDIKRRVGDEAAHDALTLAYRRLLEALTSGASSVEIPGDELRDEDGQPMDPDLVVELHLGHVLSADEVAGDLYGERGLASDPDELANAIKVQFDRVRELLDVPYNVALAEAIRAVGDFLELHHPNGLAAFDPRIEAHHPFDDAIWPGADEPSGMMLPPLDAEPAPQRRPRLPEEAAADRQTRERQARRHAVDKTVRRAVGTARREWGAVGGGAAAGAGLLTLLVTIFKGGR